MNTLEKMTTKEVNQFFNDNGIFEMSDLAAQAAQADFNNEGRLAVRAILDHEMNVRISEFTFKAEEAADLFNLHFCI